MNSIVRKIRVFFIIALVLLGGMIWISACNARPSGDGGAATLTLVNPTSGVFVVSATPSAAPTSTQMPRTATSSGSPPAVPTPQVNTQTAASPVPTKPGAAPSAPAVTPAPAAAIPSATAAVVLPTPTTGLPAAAAPTQVSASPTPAAAQACTDTAGYFGDVTIPDNTPFKQNVQFVKTWRIRNEGTCTWGAGYTLVFHGGNAMDGPYSNPMPVVAPGQTAEVSVTLKSPASAGTFTGYWVFQNPSGKRFGVNSGGIDQMWVKIGVSIFNPQNTPVPVVGGASASTPPAACPAQRNSAFEQEILGKINEERQKAGQTALKLSVPLSEAAYEHSTDMGCNKFVDHTGSNGSTWHTRIKSRGYKYAFATENIYVGDPEFGGKPDGAMKWWMNSQVHRDNILSSKVTEIGIGYSFVPTAQYKGYYTLNFARP